MYALHPRANGAGDLVHDVRIRAPRRFEDVKAVIRSFEPVHRPRGADGADCPLPQRSVTERVASSIDAQHRTADVLQVRVAKLLRLTRRMQRVREQQEAVAGESVRG